MSLTRAVLTAVLNSDKLSPKVSKFTAGKRNTQRILWSNDGLIFVTYDHYDTFYEIV